MRGVSASKEDVHNAIKNVDKGLYPKAFCKIIPDILGGDEEYCNIMHADGAGTKSSLAYIYWKETGAISVARDGVLYRNLGADSLQEHLVLFQEKRTDENETVKTIINRWKGTK
jgi:hypothetical protein